MSFGNLMSLLLGIVVGVLGPVVGLIIVAIKARGRARSLGMLGFALAGVVGILSQVFSRMLPTLMQTFNLSYRLLGIWSFLGTVLNLIPLIILALAIAANRSAAGQQQPGSPTGPTPYGANQPAPYGSNQPAPYGSDQPAPYGSDQPAPHDPPTRTDS